MCWWAELDDLGFVQSCVAFAGQFLMSFLPFLLLISAIFGSDLSRAVALRSTTPGPVLIA